MDDQIMNGSCEKREDRDDLDIILSSIRQHSGV